MIPLGTEQRVARASDGSEIVYQVLGSGRALLFVNGLAGTWRTFAQQLSYFSDRYRCIAWDYRGLFRDRAPEQPVPSLTQHARDALAILDHEGIEHSAVLGWSLGVMIALEMFELAPARISPLVLVAGAPRPSWGDRPEAGPLRRHYPRLQRGLIRVPELLELLIRQAAISPEALTWARRVGVVGPGLDAEQFADITRALRSLDVAAVLATMQLMSERDLTPVLGRVDVPTLVIGGDRDPFTSRAALERLVNSVAGAEYLLLPGASHYVLLDHAQHVNLRIDKFLSERGY